MADVEIRAATRPGFPYYFPYRTGVQLKASFAANSQLNPGADVEIRTATRPGFPYYFPYQTGFRLRAIIIAEVEINSPVGYVEIRTATRPGFPYYFPYRTGVQLKASFAANSQRGSDNTTGINSIVGLPAAIWRTTFVPGISTELKAATIAEAQISFVANSQSSVIAEIEASPPTLTGSYLIARANLQIRAQPTISPLREIFAEGFLTLNAFTVPALQLNRTLVALMSVRAEPSATMLFNREGGNPLWLVFFYAGLGTVAGSGSAEE